MNLLTGAKSDEAALGVLITLREPTKPMLTEAASAGFYEPKDFPGQYPRLQILTIAELLAGKKLEYPTRPTKPDRVCVATWCAIRAGLWYPPLQWTGKTDSTLAIT